MYIQNTFNEEIDFEKYARYENTKIAINMFMIWGILISCVVNLITSTPYGDITKFFTNIILIFFTFIICGFCYITITTIINSVISHSVKTYDKLTTITGSINVVVGLMICYFLIF